jgi:hypothetical protein
MKRPLGVHPIAVWCFLGMGFQAQSISRLVAYICGMTVSDSAVKTFEGFLLILVLWHASRLVQLKSFNRLLTIVFFSLWTVTLCFNSLILLQRSPRSARAVVVLAIFALFNIVSIWYLSRKDFRDVAAQFVQERESFKNFQIMEKISQRRILKDLKE